jgi:hypothetical protein
LTLFDDVVSSEEWLIITVRTIEDACTRKTIPISDFYKYTPPSELMHMIRNKSIYPRFLVCDPRFGAYLSSIPIQLAQMISDTIDDRYTSGEQDCEHMIEAVLAHLDASAIRSP